MRGEPVEVGSIARELGVLENERVPKIRAMQDETLREALPKN